MYLLVLSREGTNLDMHWFGVNWWDIAINVIALAIVPGVLAVLGGLLAAEGIDDQKRSRKIKAYFWAIFSFGVIVTFWQQFRLAESDLARETKESWSQLIVSKFLFRPPMPPEIAYLKTPKSNMRNGPTFHITQQSTGAKSPNQTMIGSPGGVQAGGDVTVASDKRIIQSIILRVYIETDTQPRKVTGPSDADTSAGLQSAVALFTKNRDRIRFVTDYQFKDRQISETRRRLSFTYTPETPEQIVGKEISFLTSISSCSLFKGGCPLTMQRLALSLHRANQRFL